jgi:hypothetical protein
VNELYPERPLRLDTAPGRLVAALESHPHSLSTDRWVRLLRAFDGPGYDPPTPPAAPARVISRRSRVALLTERADLGVRLWCEDDLTAMPCAEDVEVTGGPFLKQGGLTSAPARDEDDPEPWDVGDDVLTLCARAARDGTPPPVHGDPALPFARPARTPKRRAA